MKTGDIVKVMTKSGERVAVVLRKRKMFMVGPVIEVMMDGAVSTHTIENVKTLKEIENESKRLDQDA